MCSPRKCHLYTDPNRPVHHWPEIFPLLRGILIRFYMSPTVLIDLSRLDTKLYNYMRQRFFLLYQFIVGCSVEAVRKYGHNKYINDE